MKHLIIFLSIISLFFLPHCQLEKIPPVVKTFKKSVKVSEVNTSLAGIYQRSKLDSNYYVAMTLSDGTVATVLLDKDGIKAGSVVPYPTVKGGIIKAFPDGNDGFFLIGARSTNMSAVLPFFAGIPNASGPPVYQPLVMGPSTSEMSIIYDAVLTSVGKIMICGGYYLGSTGYDIGIMELEANGVKSSSKFPKIMEKYTYVGTGIAERADGQFMMTANCRTNSAPSQLCGSQTIRFSNDYSSPIWQLAIQSQDYSQKYLSGIQKVGDGLFAIYNSGYIAIVDESFTVKWETTDTHNVKKIIATSDNNMLVLGTADNKIHLTKRSAATGKVIWSETYTEPTGTIAAVTVSETLDGGFIIGGNYTKDGKTDIYIYVIKTDENGKVYE